MTTTAKPELGELEPGQKVMVLRSSNDRVGRRPGERWIPAVVVKAARVWVDLKADESLPNIQRWMTWRMRRDTQDEGTQYSGSNASFYTLEQYAWHETRSWARNVLKENGIELSYRSTWRDREIELADLITGGKRS